MIKIIKSLSVSGISIALAIATILFQVAGQSAGANKIELVKTVNQYVFMLNSKLLARADQIIKCKDGSQMI
jgi:hypothetical protein